MVMDDYGSAPYEVLNGIVEALKDLNPRSGFVSFDERQASSIKRAAKRWPEHSLGRSAANLVRAAGPGPEFAMSYADDAYWIVEAIQGRHYRRGVYPIDG